MRNPQVVTLQDNPYFASVIVKNSNTYSEDGMRPLMVLDVYFHLTQPLQLTFMEATHQISTLRLQLHNEYLGQSSLVWQSFWGDVSLPVNCKIKNAVWMALCAADVGISMDSDILDLLDLD